MLVSNAPAALAHLCCNPTRLLTCFLTGLQNISSPHTVGTHGCSAPEQRLQARA